MKKYLRKIKTALRRKHKKSYAQSGEDIILSDALRILKIANPSYIEIGTNNPIINNNTYLFYSQGLKGLCIEPDPELFKLGKETRKRDEWLNAGIGGSARQHADYYVMSSKTLNTFSKEEAEKYVQEGNFGVQKIEKVLKIPLVTINSILEKYFSKYSDILSIDTEGYDFEIIKSLDFNKYRPKIICIETACFEDKKLVKEREMIDYIINKNYFLYADTFVNSIFIDKKVWDGEK